jgi:hypothetical protein
MRTLDKIQITLSLVALSLTPGCLVVALAAGVAGVAYVNGDLEAQVDASPQKVVQASVDALKEMDVRILSSDASGIDGRVLGRTALEKKVDVTVKRETDKSSKLSIRVDTFGDETLSRQILDKIKSKL